jgi:hypothetical protein
VILMGALLASCATAPADQSVATTRVVWQPLPPSTLGAARTASQRLRAAFADEEISIDCAVNVSADRITVIGLMPAGPRMFTVSYDGQRVEAEASREVPRAFESERLLNDLQLVFWPRAALEHAFENSRWHLTEPDDRTRRLHREGKLVTEVHYASADPWTGRAWLVSFDGSYTMTIDSESLD